MNKDLITLGKDKDLSTIVIHTGEPQFRLSLVVNFHNKDKGYWTSIYIREADLSYYLVDEKLDRFDFIYKYDAFQLFCKHFTKEPQNSNLEDLMKDFCFYNGVAIKRFAD